MAENSELEARVAALEERIEVVAEDALAARHVAAAQDRDIADLGVQVRANRRAINALGEQTATGFARVDRRFEQVDRRIDQLELKVDAGFAEMRGRFDQTAAGFEQISSLLTTLIDTDPSAEDR